MGERMLMTVRTLSEAAKREWIEEVIEPNDPYVRGSRYGDS